MENPVGLLEFGANNLLPNVQPLVTRSYGGRGLNNGTCAEKLVTISHNLLPNVPLSCGAFLSSAEKLKEAC